MKAFHVKQLLLIVSELFGVLLHTYVCKIRGKIFSKEVVQMEKNYQFFTSIKLALMAPLKAAIIRKAASILKNSDLYDEYFASLVNGDFGCYKLIRAYSVPVVETEITTKEVLKYDSKSDR